MANYVEYIQIGAGGEAYPIRDATALHADGALSVEDGGTGVTSVTAGSYLVGNGTEAMVEKTPAEVLSDIGAAPAGYGLGTNGIAADDASALTGFGLYAGAGASADGTKWPTSNSLGYGVILNMPRNGYPIQMAVYGSTIGLRTKTTNGVWRDWTIVDMAKVYSSDKNMVLASEHHGDTLPTAGTPGRIFFKKA